MLVSFQQHWKEYFRKTSNRIVLKARRELFILFRLSMWACLSYIKKNENSINNEDFLKQRALQNPLIVCILYTHICHFSYIKWKIIQIYYPRSRTHTHTQTTWDDEKMWQWLNLLMIIVNQISMVEISFRFSFNSVCLCVSVCDKELIKNLHIYNFSTNFFFTKIGMISLFCELKK